MFTASILMAQRPKQSEALKALFARLWEHHRFQSNQDASTYMEGSLSDEYLRKLRNGKVPGPDALRELVRYFPEARSDFLHLSGMDDLLGPVAADARTGPDMPPFLKALSDPSANVAIIGRASAGAFEGAEAFADDTFDPVADARARGADAVWEANGDCLEELHRGDMVFIRRQQTAEVGDVVLAVVDGEPGLKMVTRHEGAKMLGVTNHKHPEYPGVLFGRGQIVGKMVGFYRKR